MVARFSGLERPLVDDDVVQSVVVAPAPNAEEQLA